jgi:hypothetical protein
MKSLSRYLQTILLLSFFLSACSNKPQSSNENPQPVQSSNQPASASSPASVSRIERPQLFALIKNMSIYPVPGRSGDVAISFVMSVSNSAVSTSASDWKIEVKSGKRIFSSEPVHVNGVVELPGTTGKTVDLDKEDLVVKARDSTIADGKPLEGILTFLLPQTSDRELLDNKATVLVVFKDKLGNSYRSTKLVVGEKK